VNKHEDHCNITSPSSGEQGECIGVLEEAVTESPVHGHSRGYGQREHIECCKDIHKLELHRLVHGVHYFPASDPDRYIPNFSFIEFVANKLVTIFGFMICDIDESNVAITYTVTA